MNSAGLSVHNETCAIRTLLFWLFARNDQNCVASLSIFCFVFVVVFSTVECNAKQTGANIFFCIYIFLYLEGLIFGILRSRIKQLEQGDTA